MPLLMLKTQIIDGFLITMVKMSYGEATLLR